MLPVHQQIIANVRAKLEPEADCLAFIVNGSVARGEAGPKSDLDYILIVPEDRLAYRSVHRFDTANCCVPPCSGLGGGLKTKTYLRDIRDHGRELLRFSFYKAMVVFSRDAEIDALVKEIPRYPEEGRVDRMERYHAQIHYHFSFFEFGYWSNTKYVIYETAVKMILAAGRMILAANRKLYPSRKYFFREVERCADKPPEFCKAAVAFLDAPSIEAGRRVIDVIEAYKKYPVPAEGLGTHKDSLLNLEEW